MKKLLSGICIALFSFSAFALKVLDCAAPEEDEFVLYIDAYPWGPAADRAVLNCGKYIEESELDYKDFEVSVTYITDQYESSRFAIKKGERKVIGAYLCDAFGKRVEEKSRYVCVEFEIGEEVSNSNPFEKNIVLKSTVSPVYGLRIKNGKLDTMNATITDIVSPKAGLFKSAEGGTDDLKLKYTYFKPENKTDKKPLIVWFHGIAEGMSDEYLPLLGTPACNLATDMIQSKFENGAHVLVPACPTAWLETTTVDANGIRVWESVDFDSFEEALSKPIRGLTDFLGVTEEKEKKETTPVATVSYYTETVKKIIDDYIRENPDVDTSRIYVGGCSAGGYMTLNMILQYPDFFAAGFPTCEAYIDSKLKDKDIKALAKIPLWFVHSKNDEVIKPKKHDEATVARIRKAGSKNIHFSYYNDVRDTTGLYKDADGNPMVFDTHSSWLYTLNNYPEENGITLFEWLAAQKNAEAAIKL